MLTYSGFFTEINVFNIFRKRKTEEAVKRSKDTWFSKITRLFDRTTLDQDVWDQLEELLIAADVGLDTTEKLIQKLRRRVDKEKATQPDQVKEILKEEIVAILNPDSRTASTENYPLIILIVGVNGSGKTTTIAKLARSYKEDGKAVLLAAADTFRAAAIDQLKWWGTKVGVDVISHQAGADPGAVVFDAIQAAKNRGTDVIIVDTAGRLHTKFNLMEELKKVKRVAQRVDENIPQQTLLVLDATTGQNGLSQAKHFTAAVHVDGIVLTKLDGTAKGGIVLAISDQLNIPIEFIGTGEQVDDLAPFDPRDFVEALLS